MLYQNSNALGNLSIRFDMAEERIHELEDR